MTGHLRADILAGGYWLHRPGPGADIAIAACGAVVPEAIDAHRQIAEDIPDAGLLVVTSPARLQRGWLQALSPSAPPSHAERLLGDLPAGSGIVTVTDGHPATLSWLGAVARHRAAPLGTDHFGQSGDITDLYRVYGLDAEAIVEAAARLLAPRIS